MASGGPDIESGSDQVKKCDLCDENFTDGYCCDCEAHMCQPCFDRHLKSKLCRHHTLSADPNLQKIDPETYSEDCKFHKNQTIKFFCSDHSAVGCAECMLENHSNCKRENIKEAAKKFEVHESGRFLETVQEMKALQDERMSEIKQLSEAVAISNDKTVNDIEEFKITMTAIVEETVHVALEKAQKVREKNEKAIDQLSRQLEGIGSSLDSFKEKLEHRDNPERLLIDAMEMRPLLEACSEALSRLNPTNSITDFKFQPDENIARIIAASKQLGEVIEEKRKPASKPGFGGTAFGQSTPATGGLFGQSSSFNSGGGQSIAFNFGSTPSSTGCLSGQETTAGTGLFGTPDKTRPSNAFGFGSSGGFGASATRASTGGLFGTMTNTGSGLFGNTVCGKQTSQSKSIDKPKPRQKLTKDQIQLAQPPTTQLRNLSTSSNLATSDNGSSFTTPEGNQVRIYMADVLNLDVDCIVRLTDSWLKPIGSVARAITKAAGQALQGDCQTYLNANKYLSEWQVCSTTAGNLPYKCVIHASVSDFLHYVISGRSQQCEDNLMQTLLNALLDAERNGMKTIALPIDSALLRLDTFCAQCVRAVKEYSSRNQAGRSTILSEIHIIATNEWERDRLQQLFASRYY